MGGRGVAGGSGGRGRGRVLGGLGSRRVLAGGLGGRRGRVLGGLGGVLGPLGVRRLGLVRGLGLVGGLRVLGLLVLSVAVHNLLAHLLGEGELNPLALGLAKLGGALLQGLGGLLNLRLVNTLLLGLGLAAQTGDGDGLVHTGLAGIRVANTDRHIHGGHNRHIVGGLLGHLLAVLVAVGLVTVAVVGLADSHHLGVGLLPEGHLNSLGSGILVLLLIVVGAHLIVDRLLRLSARGGRSLIAVLAKHNLLDGDLHGLTGGLHRGGAHLGNLGHILNRAVVLGLLVATVVGLGLVVGGLGLVAAVPGLVVAGGLGVVAAVGRGRLVAVRGTVSGGQGREEDGEKNKDL